MFGRNRISMERKKMLTGYKDDFKAEMILDNKDMLTDGQRYAIDRIIGDKHGKILFLSGKAGTGKSTVISCCKAMLKKAGKKYIVCSTTGTNARHNSGFTIYQAIGCGKRAVELKKYIGHPVDGFKEADYIFIDEASMLDRKLLDALMHYRSDKQTIILVGDLSQLPPVGAGCRFGEASQEGLKAQLFYMIGEEMETIMLTEKVRQSGDDGFGDILDRIAEEGYFEGLNDVFSDEYYITGENKQDMQRKIATILVEASLNEVNFPYIAAHRATCERVNKICMEVLKDKPSMEYKTQQLKTDSFSDLDSSIVRAVRAKVAKAMRGNSDNYNNSKDLKLFLGHKVMFTMNEREEGAKVMKYSNGTLATVIELHEDYVRVKLWDTQEEIDVYPLIDKEYVYYTDKTGKDKAFCYSAIRKLHLMSAWAITAFKSQGMTVNEAFIDTKGSFESGMVYTMLSRVKTIKGVHLVAPIREEDVIINQYAADFYRFVDEYGRGYNREELELLVRKCEVTDGRILTVEESGYLKDKEAALKRYDEYWEIAEALTRNGLFDHIRYVEYDLFHEEDITGLIDRMLEFNEITERKDPRLPAAIVEAIRRRDRVITDSWFAGHYENILDVAKYGFPLLEIDQLILDYAGESIYKEMMGYNDADPIKL